MVTAVFQAPSLDQLAPILADIGLAAPVAITDIRNGSGRVYRVDLADHANHPLMHDLRQMAKAGAPGEAVS